MVCRVARGVFSEIMIAPRNPAEAGWLSIPAAVAVAVAGAVAAAAAVAAAVAVFLFFSFHPLLLRESSFRPSRCTR